MANFIHTAGTNGFIVTPFQLFTSGDTGLSGLTSSSALIGLHGGALTTGVFTQTDFASAQYGRIWFRCAASFTPNVPGGNISGWWLNYDPVNTVYETNEVGLTPAAGVPALGRAPDFTINIYENGVAIASGDTKMSQIVPLPYSNCKLLIQNNTGVTLGAGAHTIYCGPVADTYA